MTDAVKPGIKSTEFLLTALTNVAAIATMASEVLPPTYGVPVMLVANTLYAVLRTQVKTGRRPSPRRRPAKAKPDEAR
jgi:hypothetical protein